MASSPRFEAQIKDFTVWAGEALLEVAVTDHVEQETHYVSVIMTADEVKSIARRLIIKDDMRTLERRLQDMLW